MWMFTGEVMMTQGCIHSGGRMELVGRCSSEVCVGNELRHLISKGRAPVSRLEVSRWSLASRSTGAAARTGGVR